MELEGFDGDTHSALDVSTDYSYSTNHDYDTPSGQSEEDDENDGKAYDIQNSCENTNMH